MSVLDLILQYLVLPVSAFLFGLYGKVINLQTEIAVLKSQQEHDRKSHTKEMLKLDQVHEKIFAKLDQIEAYLRK